MAQPVMINFDGFQLTSVDKVNRLLVLLNAINEHPLLKTKVCLHGGTALNLFLLGAPRLSVDIDLNYIGSVDKCQTAAERPDVEQAIIAVTKSLGFKATLGQPQHAGRTFRLSYRSGNSDEQVKIDLDYLNRSPLLPTAPKTLATINGLNVTFPVNSDVELLAGKAKALVERVAVRDLYDICNVARYYPTLMTSDDARLYRRVMLYYLSVSAPFPRSFEVARRFADRQHDVEAALYPMLKNSERPSLQNMIDIADQFIRGVAEPVDPEEVEYLTRAANADFAPELLFADYPDTLAAAQADPGAAWKLQNLYLMPCSWRHERPRRMP